MTKTEEAIVGSMIGDIVAIPRSRKCFAKLDESSTHWVMVPMIDVIRSFNRMTLALRAKNPKKPKNRRANKKLHRKKLSSR